MKHDAQCELAEVDGRMTGNTCHCAERAYARNPFVGDDGPAYRSPNS